MPGTGTGIGIADGDGAVREVGTEREVEEAEAQVVFPILMVHSAYAA